jgi:hypothetical protein
MTTLYEIEDGFQALVDSEDLVTPEQQEQYRLELVQKLETAVDKRQHMGEFIRYCELMQENCDKEIERIQKLKRTYAAAEERARDYVVFTIESLGPDQNGKYPRLAGRTLTLSVQRNPESVLIENEELVPEEYRSITLTLPLDIWSKVLAAFQAGDPCTRRVARHLKAAAERCTVNIDKAAIKHAIQSGQQVPGADLAIGRLRCKVA